MSDSRILTNLPLHGDTLRALLDKGLRTISDLANYQPYDLSEEVGISIQEALEVIQAVQSSKSLDRMLGGGIPVGQVSEICGVPGIGKTQLGMQLCLDVQIPQAFSGLEGEAIFIDTEGSFVVDRVVEMAKLLHSHLIKISQKASVTSTASPAVQAQMVQAVNNMSLETLLNGINVWRPLDSTELIAVINHLPDYLKQNPKVRLVVIDSIAFLFRHDLSDAGHKNRSLSSVSQCLQKIASDFRVAVVLTNHVTTKFDAGSGQTSIVPALGVFWHHCVTNRLMLYWQASDASKQRPEPLTAGNVTAIPPPPYVSREAVLPTTTSTQEKHPTASPAVTQMGTTTTGGGSSLLPSGIRVSQPSYVSSSQPSTPYVNQSVSVPISSSSNNAVGSGILETSAVARDDMVSQKRKLAE